MLPNQTLKTKLGNEVLLYPLPLMRRTQNENAAPYHIGTLNWDDASHGSGQSMAYSPCTLILKRRVNTTYNAAIWWSKYPVKLSNGKVSHISLLAAHTNNTALLEPIGREFKQGEPFYQEGGKGPLGENQYGNHIHFSIALGHTTSFLAKGGLRLPFAVYASNCFWVNDTQIVNGGGHLWLKYYEPPILIGSKVKIIGDTYYNGKPVPLWVKMRTYTVEKVVDKGLPTERALVQPIRSYVLTKDLVRV